MNDFYAHLFYIQRSLKQEEEGPPPPPADSPTTESQSEESASQNSDLKHFKWDKDQALGLEKRFTIVENFFSSGFAFSGTTAESDVRTDAGVSLSSSYISKSFSMRVDT